MLSLKHSFSKRPVELFLQEDEIFGSTARVALESYAAGDGQRASVLRHQVMILKNTQRARNGFA